MKNKNSTPHQIPDVAQLEAELQRENYKKRYRNVLRSTIYTLIVVAAIAILVATIWMPVLQIYGTSMNPTLNEGDIVVSVKGTNFEPGDLVAFYLGNRILVKRYIAGPGQWVYKDVIFDTSPVAGKVYKNSENRRKQGVSCGFRCICRCSICPIRAQPRCP